MYILVLLFLCCYIYVIVFFFFFKQKTAYEMRISDWSSDVCSSDLLARLRAFKIDLDNLKRFLRFKCYRRARFHGSLRHFIAVRGVTQPAGRDNAQFAKNIIPYPG